MPLAVVVGACSASTPPTTANVPTGPDPAITASDLRARLFAYADDSMLGREAGTLGNYKATAYLAAQVEALGLEPAGEDGTYFQTVELTERAFASESAITAGEETFALGTDFVPLPGDGAPIQSHGVFDGTPVVYGGVFRDSAGGLSPEDMAGKVVILSPPPQMSLTPDGVGQYAGAAGLALVILDFLPPPYIRFFTQPRLVLGGGDEASAGEFPVAMAISGRMAEAMLGQSLADAEVGAAGTPVTGSIRVTREPPEYPSRNVVAILRGSDPELRDEYVAIGSHNDHDGITSQPIDQDSLWAVRQVTRGPGAVGGGELSDAQRAEIRAKLDSLRAIRPARMDSVYNGADDDGSCTITALEIAEAFALRPERPRR
jgi:hypothetical protein